MQSFFSLAEQTSHWLHAINQAKKLCASLESITVYSEFYLQASNVLADADSQKLTNILQAQKYVEFEAPQSDACIRVVPRLGTYSSWGSKALELLHHMGLTQCQRIERGHVFYFIFSGKALPEGDVLEKMYAIFFDKMTESLVLEANDLQSIFDVPVPQPYQAIDIQNKLEQANIELGLALSETEMAFLRQSFAKISRNPTDAELMMFAQINSEHCRHKIFNASWTLDGEQKPKSLLDMIKNTYQQSPDGVLSAYSDNSAVMSSHDDSETGFYRDINNQYQFGRQKNQILMKVETHNHPTAIEPFAGSGTGQGGEIRDEGATGRGSCPKVGLSGFTVSNLNIPNFPRVWEHKSKSPKRIQSALDIMLKAPIGGAAFNNEFGRPCICGYFRTYEHVTQSDTTEYQAFGFHKPIMIAGGMGKIQNNHVQKNKVQDGDLLLVLGGSALKIGIGGGSASSMSQGQSDEGLDFASVQRQNPEMQRRAQEVIEQCRGMNENNPIISIHDVGAGGLANALSEIVHDCGLGALLQLENIPVADSSMSPLEVWCNESQERYIIAIAKKDLKTFDKIAQKERCPYSVLGHAADSGHITIEDKANHNKPVDMPLSILFANPPKLKKSLHREKTAYPAVNTQVYNLKDALERVLNCPTVADKSFLITIGDRTVTGLVARDQMVGPWQVPVADCGVSASNYTGHTGEAMSMGEKPALSLISPQSMARMAVSESILNILSADIQDLSDIKLSCNWMADANTAEQAIALYDAVEAIGEQFCPELGIAIPVGKDSLSMQTQWIDTDRADNEIQNKVISPLALVVSAFAPVKDIRQTITPLLNTDESEQDSVLLFIDLADKNQRMGGSIFAQVTNQIGDVCPDVAPQKVKDFALAMRALRDQEWVMAYHDKSDGGLWACLCEMAFASNTGLDINISDYTLGAKKGRVQALLNEELGAVIQVSKDNMKSALDILSGFGLQQSTYTIARLNKHQSINVFSNGQCAYTSKRGELHKIWSQTSLHVSALRDNPETAKAAFESINTEQNPGLDFSVSQEYLLNPPSQDVLNQANKPKIAILREQGVNGHNEMAAAFTLAGFDAMDMTMQDLIDGKNLEDFHGLAVCGGFSYGDVLGAGLGWANAILHTPHLNQVFVKFFARTDTFTLGVCNGCQMLSAIKELIPGAEHWPSFVKNQSEQFEARLSLVEIVDSPSILLKDMVGLKVPVAVAHGEGQVLYTESDINQDKKHEKYHSLRYINNSGELTEQYPYNPNGSEEGMTGFTTVDGRVTIMMPHPERVFKNWQMSWVPKAWAEQANASPHDGDSGNSPWMQIFYNARNWLETNVKI